MQSTSTLQTLSLRKNLRAGQRQVIEAVESGDKTALNIKLPTGYGKTLVATVSYSVLKRQGKVNRLLMIFPTDAQLEQFVQDGPEDLLDADVDGNRSVIDVRYFGTEALKRHRKGTNQVFAITVQSMTPHSAGMENIAAMMSQGNWMVVVDEYHHYGIDATWGNSVMALNSAFRLAMSATPERPNDDSAFGPPDISVPYQKAVEEKAVKPLEGHSYVYRIDAIDSDGDVISYTTSELVKEAGGDGDKIEKLKVNRKMRWSPKYVSPLVTFPIERMMRDRLITGYKLQAIVGAMCVSHAELVCGQVQSLFPELSVDWVGTGIDGRSKEQNKSIIKKFCPKKDHQGNRVPSLDILIHVGMAGEGLDSTLVSEVVHLNKASKNNSNDQENGRAARYLEGVTGNINFDSSSDYSKFVGAAIMEAMDCNEPDEEREDEPKERDDSELAELPEEPNIQILNLELEGIDSGSPEILRMKDVLVKLVGEYTKDDIEDPESSIHGAAMKEFRNMRQAECDAHNEQAIVAQWGDAVNSALTVVTSLVVRKITAEGARADKTLAGDIKKRINRQKKMQLGAVAKDIEVCRTHYQWIKTLEQTVLGGGMPTWLV